MRKLVLFDIDGTLVLTGGAGLRAMNRALARGLRARRRPRRASRVAGRTDWAILSDAVRRVGRSLDGALLADLEHRYVTNLAEEIQHPGSGRKEVMPGIREILDELERRDDVFVGLLTGNFEAGARSSSATSISGATSAAARLAATPPTATRWCRSPSSARARCGLPDIADSRRPRRSATRRTT